MTVVSPSVTGAVRRAAVGRAAAALRPLRWRAKRRLGALEPGAVTVVTVNWNSVDMLEVAIDQVRRHSPASTRMLVIDNHSDVDPRPQIRSIAPWVRTLRLPVNLGHGLALDIGALLTSSEYLVTLDVDAFPLSEAWLPTLLDPLDEGAEVVGCAGYRGLAHPCGLAMRTARFVSARHTFVARFTGGPDGWDVGERISIREAPDFEILPRTDSIGQALGEPEIVGSVFADVIYHNYYGTRHLREADPEAALDLGATRSRSLDVWAAALERFGIEEGPTRTAGEESS